jgi:hypothetical protein
MKRSYGRQGLFFIKGKATIARMHYVVLVFGLGFLTAFGMTFEFFVRWERSSSPEANYSSPFNKTSGLSFRMERSGMRNLAELQITNNQRMKYELIFYFVRKALAALGRKRAAIIF